MNPLSEPTIITVIVSVYNNHTKKDNSHAKTRAVAAVVVLVVAVVIVLVIVVSVVIVVVVVVLLLLLLLLPLLLLRTTTTTDDNDANNSRTAQAQIHLAAICVFASCFQNYMRPSTRSCMSEHLHTLKVCCIFVLYVTTKGLSAKSPRTESGPLNHPSFSAIRLRCPS